jgi:hypothetical protein
MKTKFTIAAVALLGFGGAMHLGKVRVCPLGMMIHGLHKNTAQKPAAKPVPTSTATITATQVK